MKTLNRLYVLPVLFLLTALLSCQTPPPDTATDDTDFKVVGYLGPRGFDVIDDIELEKLTHLNLAFANPGENGSVVFSRDADIRPIVEKGHAAGLQVYVSLAGGGRPDTTLWKSVLQPENMPAFVDSLMAYVETHDLDGVDVDIEGNLLPYIGDTYTPFVLALRDALHAAGKGITTALGAVHVHEGVTQASLEAYDFINVMVYDKTGVWRPDVIGPHSPFSYAEEAILYWTQVRGVAAKDLTLGVPFYGFDFTPPARYISYREIVRQDVAHAYQDSIGVIHYNGIPTIVDKAELAKELLGGLMIWEISYDTLGSDLSLLRALDQTLEAGDCEVHTFYRDEDGDGLGSPSHPYQACEAPEGYVDNRDDVDEPA